MSREAAHLKICFEAGRVGPNSIFCEGVEGASTNTLGSSARTGNGCQGQALRVLAEKRSQPLTTVAGAGEPEGGEGDGAAEAAHASGGAPAQELEMKSRARCICSQRQIVEAGITFALETANGCLVALIADPLKLFKKVGGWRKKNI